MLVIEGLPVLGMAWSMYDFPSCSMCPFGSPSNYIFILITLGLKPVSKLMQNRNQGTHVFFFVAWFRWSDPAKSQNCCAFGNAACLRKFEALFEM